MPSNKKKKKTKTKKTTVPTGTGTGIDSLMNEQQQQPSAQFIETNYGENYEGSDPLATTYASFIVQARRRQLYDLGQVLPQIVYALDRNDRGALVGALTIIYGLGNAKQASETMSIHQIRSKLDEYCNAHLRPAFMVFSSKEYANNLSQPQNDGRCCAVSQILASKSSFDVAHQMQVMKETMMSSVHQKQSVAEKIKILDDFEAENPIDTYEREKEPGYSTAKRQAAALTNAEQANELGKRAWVAKRKWTAELYWQKATEIDNNNNNKGKQQQREPKYYSNLALARTRLGRYLRSLPIGYRRLADGMIHQAIQDAATSIDIDPTWERAYQRQAEAYLALGPYEHALSACRILKKAIDRNGDDESCASPSSSAAALVKLYDRAKNNARIWCPVVSRRRQSQINDDDNDTPSIKATLEAALGHLRSTLVRNVAVDLMSDDEIQNAGDEIADAAHAMLGALQLKYLCRGQWDRESNNASHRQSSDEGGGPIGNVMNDIEFQIQLRQISKLVPLRAVELSMPLHCLALMKDPYFSLWGLNAMDRAGVDSSLPFDAVDPCEKDGTELNDAACEEKMKRETGCHAMDMASILSVLEKVEGQNAITSYDKDMAPHQLCSFSFSLLQRLVMARKDFPALAKSATERIIELCWVENGNGYMMGGEFLGMAVNCAAGVGKHGLVEDPEQTKAFMEKNGGIAVMAKEIGHSEDNHFFYQKALANYHPSDWATVSAFDISRLLRHYLLVGMDDDCLSLKKEEIGPYAAKILSSILDGYPLTTMLFKDGNMSVVDDLLELDVADLTDQQITFCLIIRSLSISAFGNFVMRQFVAYKQNLFNDRNSSSSNTQHEEPTTEEVILYMVQRWNSLSSNKRSAYRWESLDKRTKQKLSSMAPVDKMDYLKAKEEKKVHAKAQEQKDEKGSEKSSDFRKGSVVAKLPECACCGMQEGFGVILLNCPCGAVKYCGRECQEKHRPEHKGICKELRSRHSKDEERS